MKYAKNRSLQLGIGIVVFFASLTTANGADEPSTPSVEPWMNLAQQQLDQVHAVDQRGILRSLLARSAARAGMTERYEQLHQQVRQAMLRKTKRPLFDSHDTGLEDVRIAMMLNLAVAQAYAGHGDQAVTLAVASLLPGQQFRALVEVAHASYEAGDIAALRHAYRLATMLLSEYPDQPILRIDRLVELLTKLGKYEDALQLAQKQRNHPEFHALVSMYRWVEDDRESLKHMRDASKLMRQVQERQKAGGTLNDPTLDPNRSAIWVGVVNILHGSSGPGTQLIQLVDSAMQAEAWAKLVQLSTQRRHIPTRRIALQQMQRLSESLGTPQQAAMTYYHLMYAEAYADPGKASDSGELMQQIKGLEQPAAVRFRAALGVMEALLDHKASSDAQ